LSSEHPAAELGSFGDLRPKIIVSRLEAAVRNQGVWQHSAGVIQKRSYAAGEAPGRNTPRVDDLTPATAVAWLQRTAGNAAAQRLLVARSPEAPPVRPRGGPFATPDKFKIPDVPNLNLPTVSDPNKEMVVIDDQDARKTKRLGRGVVRKDANYVDNAVVSVGVSKMEFWTATIEEFDFRFTSGSHPPLKVLVGEFDVTAYMPAAQYIKLGGVIFPIGSRGQVAFDEENTPRMTRGALGKLADAERVRSQRRMMSAMVFSFQMILAQLVLASIGIPEGQFGGGVLRTGGRAGGGAPPFSFATDEAWIYEGRMIRVVKTPTGPRAFYRRTGGGGGSEIMGAQAGDWVPFLGFKPNPGGAQFIKPPSAVELAPSQPLTLLRWGNEEAMAASRWIQAQHRELTPLAINVGENWGRIQLRLQELGVFVEFPL
jgi:hypothetical protein